MKVVFDNSIHLGQFSTTKKDLRIFAKNLQVSLSSVNKDGVIGIETYNENSYTDDYIWSLDRKTQDGFYKFMDLFHSTKNIVRVPIKPEHLDQATSLADKYKIHISNALTCSVAISSRADQIHSLYKDFRNKQLLEFLLEKGIEVCKPESVSEETYLEKELEKYYNVALKLFQKKKIEPTVEFHS